jgi:hypothetical protein
MQRSQTPVIGHSGTYLRPNHDLIALQVQNAFRNTSCLMQQCKVQTEMSRTESVIIIGTGIKRCLPYMQIHQCTPIPFPRSNRFFFTRPLSSLAAFFFPPLPCFFPSLSSPASPCVCPFDGSSFIAVFFISSAL